MSIKTLRKRIALVAVSALGVGLLSVAPAKAATAGFESFTANASCAALNAAGANVALNAAASGISTVRTLILPVGASITAMPTEGTTAYITTTGGRITQSTGGSVDADGLAATISDGDSGDLQMTFPVAGTFTVNLYDSSSDSDGADDVLTVSVVNSCDTSTWDRSNSFVETITAYDTDSTVTTNVDTAVTAGAGTDLYIQLKGYNGYNATISSGTLYVSATNGAKVAIGATLGARPDTGSYSVATASTSTGEAVVRVSRASASVGLNTTVTITHNGTLVTTKSLTLLGEAKSIKVVRVSSGTVGTTGASNTGYIRYQLLDAAGSPVPGDVSLDSLTATARTPQFTLGKEATIAAAGVTNFSSLGNITDGVEGFDCTNAGGIGKSTLRVTHTAAVTSAVIETTVDAPCAGGVATFTISTDKASYKIGEVATITISAKDASGGPVSDATTLGSDVSASFGGGTVVLAPASGDKFRDGARTFQAQVTTSGTFNVVVNIPTGTVTKSAIASYAVAGDGSVTNAEVLASIVKLIAAINEQIKALQKSLKKR